MTDPATLPWGDKLMMPFCVTRIAAAGGRKLSTKKRPGAVGDLVAVLLSRAGVRAARGPGWYNQARLAGWEADNHRATREALR